MVRWFAFFSCSASFAVVGLASLRRVSTICTVPVGEVHFEPLASLACCGTSFVGMPSRTPVPASVTIFQPTFSRRRLAVSARPSRSCGLSAPVCRAPRLFWYSLIAATMRSETSPVMAPLYSPTQARSDCSASRSAVAIALAVSAGVCVGAGRIGVVATGFGLVPAVDGGVICAWVVCASAKSAAKAAIAIPNHVADSTVLMTNPGHCRFADYAHLLGRQQPDARSDQPHPEERRKPRLEGWATGLMVRDARSRAPHHEGRERDAERQGT